MVELVAHHFPFVDAEYLAMCEDFGWEDRLRSGLVDDSRPGEKRESFPNPEEVGREFAVRVVFDGNLVILRKRCEPFFGSHLLNELKVLHLLIRDWFVPLDFQPPD